MKTSKKGVFLIKKYEGFKSNPYMCPADVPTIGYGATYYQNGKKVMLSDTPITKVQAEQLLRFQLKIYESAVDRYTRVDITQNQFDALVSFAFNTGIGSFKNSTLLKKVNKNPNDSSISYEFSRWIHSGGRVLKGLKKRRQEEANLYFS